MIRNLATTSFQKICKAENDGIYGKERCGKIIIEKEIIEIRPRETGVF